jgi:peptidoglycan/LPS O-acetylase OafA/YrhL
MKRGLIVLFVALLVLLTTGLWLLSESGKLKSFDILSIGVILLVVAFAVFVGYKRLTSARRGEPSEDELSRKVLLRTAAYSYYISLYLWVAILFIKDRVKLDTEELLGAGILGMALTFALCWLVINFRGVRNE